MSSFVSGNGPSMTLGVPFAKRTRAPFELGCSPSPPSITPALASSSLYLAIASSVFCCGMTPASVSLFALRIIMKRIARRLLVISTSGGWSNRQRQDRHGGSEEHDPPGSSGNERARAIHDFVLSDHERRRVVGFLADVFEQLRVGFPHEIRTSCNWSRVRSRIVDGQLVAHRSEFGAREALDGVQAARVRQHAAILPEVLVEAHGVDDERVAFPPADRVSVELGPRIGGMRAAVHV